MKLHYVPGQGYTTKPNYKKAYGFTLSEAKNKARVILGRLPKCGYEVMIDSGYTDTAKQYKTFLVNEGGSYRIWQWIDPNTDYEGYYQYRRNWHCS